MGAFEGFEWDDEKDRINREKHDLPLIAASSLFDDPSYTEGPSNQPHIAEQRVIAIGSVRGRLLTCVYVWRGSVRRIISLRNASRKERRAYQEATKG